ncbi:MAG: MFS transporter, partial [Lentisphaerae bacterium]|nr:MFS transporter [Lentisphaerota bacterium]
SVVPSILPLKLKGLGCSNWLMGLILTTAPGILNMTVCPYVSFKSDRYRSRWGRRIPFIIWTMPFLCGSLALMGLSDDVCGLLQRNSEFLRQFTPATVTIALIAFFLIMFQFFNMFVGSVFWYLFNDVVPPQFLARFIGMFKIVGTGAGALYNFFIFKFAESHMREIFIGAAVLYFIGFGIACLMVKEGDYPPPEGENDNSGKGLEGIKTFFRESFSHKFYWFRFLSTAFAAVAWAIGAFIIFFNREMGLSLDQIGKINAIGSITIMAAMYLMSIFVDRWHPLRITVYGAVCGVLLNFTSMVWIFVTIPGNYFFWLNLGNVLIGTCFGALTSVAGLPTEMRTFPRSRYGQFCSAQAMLRSTFTVISGVLAGLFIDLIRNLCNGSDYAYRFIFLWTTLFSGISAIFLVMAYIEWYRLGGDKHFHPPAPWSPKGFEEMPAVPIVGPQTKWLKISFLFFDGVMGLSVLSIPVLMWWMYSKQQMFAFKWYGLAVLPLCLLGWVCWMVVKQKLLRDMAAAKEGSPLRNGIPHHGMLIVIGSNFLLSVGIWVCQVLVTVSLNMEGGSIVFGIANGLTNFLLIGGFYMMCRIERGFSVTVDEKYEAIDNTSTPSTT